jgi:hypothetical protein
MIHLYPGTSGLVYGLAAFALIWGVAYRISNYSEFTFEPRGPGSFEPRLANYTRAAETVTGLASASIVLLAGSSVLRSSGQSPSLPHLPWYYGSPLVLSGLSVVYAVSFITFLVFFYEAFLHGRPYTRVRYSLVQALGFASLLCFSSAYIVLGFALANQ